jgi:hypothetical protein
MSGFCEVVVSKFLKCMVRRVNAREKFRTKKVCVNVCGLSVESNLLAMMRYAAYLSFKTPRLYESHLRNQVSGTPF